MAVSARGAFGSWKTHLDLLSPGRGLDLPQHTPKESVLRFPSN